MASDEWREGLIKRSVLSAFSTIRTCVNVVTLALINLAAAPFGSTFVVISSSPASSSGHVDRRPVTERNPAVLLPLAKDTPEPLGPSLALAGLMRGE